MEGVLSVDDEVKNDSEAENLGFEASELVHDELGRVAIHIGVVTHDILVLQLLQLGAGDRLNIPQPRKFEHLVLDQDLIRRKVFVDEPHFPKVVENP